jgi:hypothetical protein
MSIVRRKDSAGRTYYINTTTGKRATEASYKRSHSSAKSSKTQFKSKAGYACSSAGRDLKVKQTSSAGRRLRKCAL